LCSTLTPGHDAVQKVTLVPRGQARGLTWFIPNDDPTLISKQQIFARIVGGLGGRAAEEVVFGENEITTGAVGDLMQISGMAKQVSLATGDHKLRPSREENPGLRKCYKRRTVWAGGLDGLAPEFTGDCMVDVSSELTCPSCLLPLPLVQMVTAFGMSDIGPWSLMDQGGQSGDVIMRMMARNSMSEKLAEDIDAAVKRISDEAYEVALGHIRNNREAIDRIVEVLVEKETLSGEEFRAILSEFTEIPVENRYDAVKALAA